MVPPRREADMTWILVRIGVESPTFALQEHVSTVIVGRGADCTLRCPGESISRKHCEFRRCISNYDQKIYWNIFDTKSSIGVFVNGSKIPAEKEIRLNDQDVISLSGNISENECSTDKNKRRLFMYRVVAPSGMFPEEDEDGASDATLSPEHATQMPLVDVHASPEQLSPADTNVQRGKSTVSEPKSLAGDAFEEDGDVNGSSQPFCGLLKPDLMSQDEEEEMTASQETKMKEKRKTKESKKKKDGSRKDKQVSDEIVDRVDSLSRILIDDEDDGEVTPSTSALPKARGPSTPPAEGSKRHHELQSKATKEKRQQNRSRQGRDRRRSSSSLNSEDEFYDKVNEIKVKCQKNKSSSSGSKSTTTGKSQKSTVKSQQSSEKANTSEKAAYNMAANISTTSSPRSIKTFSSPDAVVKQEQKANSKSKNQRNATAKRSLSNPPRDGKKCFSVVSSSSDDEEEVRPKKGTVLSVLSSSSEEDVKPFISYREKLIKEEKVKVEDMQRVKEEKPNVRDIKKEDKTREMTEKKEAEENRSRKINKLSRKQGNKRESTRDDPKLDSGALRVNVEMFEDVGPSVYGALLSPDTQRVKKWLKPEPKQEPHTGEENCDSEGNEELEVLYNSYTEGPGVINLCDSEEESEHFMASQQLMMEAAELNMSIKQEQDSEEEEFSKDDLEDNEELEVICTNKEEEEDDGDEEEVALLADSQTALFEKILAKKSVKEKMVIKQEPSDELDDSRQAECAVIDLDDVTEVGPLAFYA